MTPHFPIISNTIAPDEIYEKLSALLDDKSSVELELRKESEDDMALDPITLVAIINGSSMILSAIITGLFSIWTEKRKAQADRKTAEVRIRVDKEGTEIVFPYGMPKEEQRQLIRTAIELSKVRQIALIEKA